MSEIFSANEIFEELQKLPGGYVYSGAASLQVCFPLRDGGELRFAICDEKPSGFDIYDGSLPGITGPTHPTGERP